MDPLTLCTLVKQTVIYFSSILTYSNRAAVSIQWDNVHFLG